MHLLPYLNICLSCPQTSLPFPINRPWQHIHFEAWVRWEGQRLLTLPDKDPLSHPSGGPLQGPSWTAPQRVPAGLRALPTAMTAWWHSLGLAFPPSVSLLSVSHSCSLESLTKIIYLHTNSVFWGFLVQANRGHGTCASSHRGCTHMLTCTPWSCVHMHTTIGILQGLLLLSA